MKTETEITILSLTQTHEPCVGREIIDAINVLLRCIFSDETLTSPDALHDFFHHGGILFLALEGDTIVGMASVVPVYTVNGIRRTLKHVAVHPRYARQRIGEKLCRHALDFARITGSLMIDVNCSATNTAANKLFEKVGFQAQNAVSRSMLL